MTPRTRLLLGPLAGAVLLTGIIGLARWIPGYSHLRQTVSEIGAAGSPVRVPFAVMLCLVAGCTLVFAAGLRAWSRQRGLSLVPAYLTGAMAISAAGVAVFAHPHPLHNVFGLSELIGYQAPLALAITWRGHRPARLLVGLSWMTGLLVVIAVWLNLSALVGPDAVWMYVQPRYGLAQRALFAAWFGWAAAVGGSLYAGRGHATPAGG